MPPRRWRHIGGPADPGPSPEPRPPKTWMDTGSGPGVEIVPDGGKPRLYAVPAFPTGTLSGVVRGPWDGDGRTVGGCLDSAPPDLLPHGVKGDAFRMLMVRHEPISGTHCASGCLLGEDTGLCATARIAKRGLENLVAEERASRAARESRERDGEFGAPPV